MKTKTETELVQLAMESNHRAFEELMARNKKAVFAVFHQFNISNLNRDDLYQDLSIKVWVSLQERKYQERGYKFRTFLKKIARNLCIDCFRLNKKLQKISLEEEYLPLSVHSEPIVINNILDEEYREKLVGFIQSLGHRDRVIYYLRIDREWPFQKIADLFGISISTALGSMRYTRGKFKKKYLFEL